MSRWPVPRIDGAALPTHHGDGANEAVIPADTGISVGPHSGPYRLPGL